MHTETALLATITAGFGLAFVAGLLAVKLRLPPIVGYLLAGVALGPFTPGIEADVGLAQQLAEIGVVLLLFGVGLHFAPGDLKAVRRIVVPAALGQVGLGTALGAGVGLAFGWSIGGALVFGVCCSVASTVVVVRAFEDRDMAGSPPERIAVGWLILEDLAMVLVLVLLPLLAPLLGAPIPAGTAPPSTGEVVRTAAITIGAVATFLALMVVVGRRALPWLLQRVAATGSRELFTLAVLATAIGIALGAAGTFKVSAALGAFVAGVVVGESEQGYRAASEALPFQDAFAVLFFVSVGMLFDPRIVIEMPLQVLATFVLILGANAGLAWIGLRLLRHPVGESRYVVASLGQIGEFSFILAGAGVAAGLLPTEGRSLVLAGAILSIVFNPVLFRWAARRDAREAQSATRLTMELPLPVATTGAVVLVGAGRVGTTIAGALRTRGGVPLVIVEADERVAKGARGREVRTIVGDATHPPVLVGAGIHEAQLLVVALPDGFQSRRVIDVARSINPRIPVIVRTHSERDYEELGARTRTSAHLAERQVAFAMASDALESLGDDAETVAAVLDTIKLPTPRA
ncbi:MAG: cation:proton antiporter [Gemmatimonadaceae bacterium]|jgi:CPA2 family monovalent cation:H+ antiporter-2|nr:cation:proton antiporter [Gemmatimonadaceae bacterium]